MLASSQPAPYLHSHPCITLVCQEPKARATFVSAFSSPRAQRLCELSAVPGTTEYYYGRRAHTCARLWGGGLSISLGGVTSHPQLDPQLMVGSTCWQVVSSWAPLNRNTLCHQLSLSNFMAAVTQSLSVKNQFEIDDKWYQIMLFS